MPRKVESSRKNHALIFAREHAGLTQAEAAELVTVSARTFSRWETTAVQMPNRKWNKFLRAVNLTAADIPKPPECDATSYPVNIEPPKPSFPAGELELRLRDRQRVYRQAATKAGENRGALNRYMADYDKRNGLTDLVGDDGEDLAG
jgi:hypothetical protein